MIKLKYYSFLITLCLCILTTSCGDDDDMGPENQFSSFLQSDLFLNGDYSALCSLSDPIPEIEEGTAFENGARNDYRVFLNEAMDETYILRVDIFDNPGFAEGELQVRLDMIAGPDVSMTELTDIDDQAVFSEFSNGTGEISLHVRRSNALVILNSIEPPGEDLHCSHSLDEMRIFVLEVLDNLVGL